MVRQYSSVAVETTLAGGVTDSATSIQVASTSGFPVGFPYTLSLDAGNASKELVEVTAAAGTTLTVTRGVDGTSGVAHLLGAAVRHDHSARDFRESAEHIGADGDVHGVTGSVVGTSDTQALTNKDLSDPSNTFPGALATDVELAAHADATVAHGAEGDVVGQTNTQDLLNKTLNLALNSIYGTKADFDTALTDGVFVSESATQTLSNKSFTDLTLEGEDLDGQWTMFTPTWTSDGSAPAIGDGTLVGYYKGIGAYATLFSLFLIIGSTTTLGSGNYSLSLPSVPYSPRALVPGTLWDASASLRYPIALEMNSSNSTALLLRWPTTAGGNFLGVTASGPVSLATGDMLAFTGSYNG